MILHFQKQQVGERHHQQQMSADAAEAKVKGIPFGFIDCLVQACDECHQIDEPKTVKAPVSPSKLGQSG